mgnify:CR=1 FL=1
MNLTGSKKTLVVLVIEFFSSKSPYPIPSFAATNARKHLHWQV